MVTLTYGASHLVAVVYEGLSYCQGRLGEGSLLYSESFGRWSIAI